MDEKALINHFIKQSEKIHVIQLSDSNGTPLFFLSKEEGRIFKINPNLVAKITSAIRIVLEEELNSLDKREDLPIV